MARPGDRAGYKPTIRETILHNASLPEAQRKTYAEMAADLGVRVQSLYVCASNMRRLGLLKEGDPAAASSMNTHFDVPGAGPQPDPAYAAERLLEQALGRPIGKAQKRAKSKPMTKVERVARLSEIGRLAPSNVSVLAVRALEDMDRQQGLDVGPPRPLVEQEQIERLGRLNLAVGRRISDLARDWAWGGSNERVVEDLLEAEDEGESGEEGSGAEDSGDSAAPASTPDPL